MSEVKCDVVLCIFNFDCICIADTVEIVLSHVGATEVLNCATYKEPK